MLVKDQPIVFGLADYWRMFANRGVKLVWRYFWDCHFFDLKNGTDTHKWLPKTAYVDHPGNLNHGVLYMSSWTSEIHASFAALRRLGVDLNQYVFVDIGCGKGKVVLEWRNLLGQHGYQQRLIGIDYSSWLIKVAVENHRRMHGVDGEFLEADASMFDYSQFGDRLIFYLFNPFDAEILGATIDAMASSDTFIIYSNPVCQHELLRRGFEIVYERWGFHPNCQTRIFRRMLNPRLGGAKVLSGRTRLA